MAGAERLLPSLSRASGKSKKLQPLRYTAARLLEKGVLLEIEDLPVSQYVPLPPGRAVAAQSSGTGREVAALAVLLGLQWMRDPLRGRLPSLQVQERHLRHRALRGGREVPGESQVHGDRHGEVPAALPGGELGAEMGVLSQEWGSCAVGKPPPAPFFPSRGDVHPSCRTCCSCSTRA